MFTVRNQQLRELLATGGIELPCDFILSAVYDFSDCGVVVTSGSDEYARGVIARDIPVITGNSLEYPRTLLWDTTAKLRADLVSVGFDRLAHGWQIAIPLASYRTLARDIGDDAGREVTEGVIHDLRVPFFDVRAMFIRKCATTEKLMETYTAELLVNTEPRLAFMRALYKVKPILCALPATWVGK